MSECWWAPSRCTPLPLALPLLGSRVGAKPLALGGVRASRGAAIKTKARHEQLPRFAESDVARSVSQSAVNTAAALPFSEGEVSHGGPAALHTPFPAIGQATL